MLESNTILLLMRIMVILTLGQVLVFYLLLMHKRKIYKTEPDMEYDKKDVLLRLFFIETIPVYQAMISILFYIACEKDNQVILIMQIILFLISILLNSFVLSYISAMDEKRRQELEIQTLYEQRSIEQDYLDSKQECIASQNEMRRQFAEQLEKVREMIKSSEDEETIQGFIRESYENLQETRIEKYCENTIANTVLVMKKEVARKKQIDMRVGASFPENSNMERIDICSVLCNLLDNAIEACERISNDAIPKNIEVKIKEAAGYVVIKVENSKEGMLTKHAGRILTSKKNKKIHGYGLKLIQEIAKKYHGKVEITEEENSIRMVVWLECRV